MASLFYYRLLLLCLFTVSTGSWFYFYWTDIADTSRWTLPLIHHQLFDGPTSDSDHLTTDPSDSDHLTTVPPDSDHLTTDPSDSDHLTTDPPDSDHLTTDPSDSDHLTTDPSDSDHLTTDPSDSDHLTTDPSDSDHLTTDPSDSDHLTTDPSDSDHLTTDPPGLTPIPVLHRKDYRKLPWWDFEDEYRRDRMPSKTSQRCESSLWNIINQDSELKEKFIPNIRMYVYNGSITMSEWNRLSHFNNPFGFMDYNYKDVVPAINLVHKPKFPLLSPKPGQDCISCAVVGTGGVLWRSKKGAEIDSHDYVFRVNGAVIKGFEEDVGNRTDVYVHTAFSITNSEINLSKLHYRAPHDEGIKYVLIPEAMRDFEWLTGLYKRERLVGGSFPNRRPWTQYCDHFNETRFYVLHMDFLRYIRNRFLNSTWLQGTHWTIHRPTNGAFMMFLALQVCDRVDAYGFITDNHNKYSNYYYQRGANTHMVFYTNHNYNMEKDLWKKLHDLNIINLYMGEEAEPTTSPQNRTSESNDYRINSSTT